MRTGSTLDEDTNAPAGGKRIRQFPLSFSQQRLWFIEQLESEQTAYNMTSAWRLKGPLNATCLQQAIETVVRRHEILRTVIVVEGESPIQRVRGFDGYPLSAVDLRHLSNDEQDNAIQKHVLDQSSLTFDLTQDLMLRTKLLQLGKEEHILILAMHHIASDGWSVSVLIRELSQCYTAYVANEQPSLPPLKMQYGDFATAQRSADQDDDDSLKYWLNQLDGAPHFLELPTDRPRLDRQQYQGACQTRILSKDVSQSLTQLAASVGATPYMAVLAAFKILLGRLTGQRDVVVGAPFAGRTTLESERLIGLFVNTVVLRTVIAPSVSFRELLTGTRNLILDAHEHQDVPFERLVEAIGPERHLNRSPLIQVLVNGVTMKHSDWSLPNLTVSEIDFEIPVSKYDMTLYVENVDGRIRLDLVYAKQLFDEVRIKCMLDQLQHVLSQTSAMPDEEIGAMSLVTAEHKQLLSDPTLPMKGENVPRISERIEHLATTSPHRTAVRHGESRWTYRELWSASTRFRNHLDGQGIQKGEIVAVIGRPCRGLVSTMIGTFRHGSVLAMLDENTPPNRCREVLEHIRPTLVVSFGDADKELPDCCLLCVDTETGAPGTAIGSSSNRREPLPPRAAYVSFTSGTTGRPKAVVGTHDGLSQFIDWQSSRYGIGADDQIPQMLGLSYEAAFREFFLPLTSGGTLHLHSYQEPTDIWRWLEASRITAFHVVPTMLTAWLPFASPDIRLASLKSVFFGGCQLNSQLIRQWRERFPDTSVLVNLYGTTETPQGRVFYEVPTEADVREGPQPIGTPIDATQAIVINKQQRQCGIGEIGELTIRSPYRSLGYLHDADSDGCNSDGYRQNPSRNDSHDVIYYTGDLARYGCDGNIQLYGRSDEQLNIEGIRIEPADLQNTLNTHSMVENSHVGTVSGRNSQDDLAAWVVLRQNASLDSGDLRRHLCQSFPAAVVPKKFFSVPSIPLTDHGKVHVLKLREHETDEVRSNGRRRVATATEEFLVNLWKEVLDVPDVAVDDNFFKLGGHSLQIASMLLRIREHTGHNLPFAIVFQAPTVAELARAMHEKNVAPRLRSVIPLTTRGDDTPILWVHGPASSCPIIADEFPSRPIYLIRAFEFDGRTKPPNRVEEVADRYVEEARSLNLRRVVIGGYSFGGVVAFEMAHQLRNLGVEVEFVFLMDPAVWDHSPMAIHQQHNLVPIQQLGAPPQRESHVDRVGRHLRRLSTDRSRWQYIRSRLNGWRKRARHTLVRSRGTLLVSQLCARLGASVPMAFREQYRNAHFRAAKKQYEPHAFQGKVALFNTYAAPSDLSIWDHLATSRYSVPRLQHHEWTRPKYLRLMFEAIKSELETDS